MGSSSRTVSTAPPSFRFIFLTHVFYCTMAPMKKVAAKAMSKGAFLKAIADEHGLKTKECAQVFNSLVDIATKEVKKTGVFTIPGLCRIKTRVKPATKAGMRNIFGKEVKVAAKPVKTVVKAFAAAALKKQI